MKKVFLVIFVLLVANFTLPANRVYTADQIGEELKLYLGEIKILPASDPLRIAIGNPDIADVGNVTKHEITLSPKAVGNTTLIFWDNFGEQSFRIKVCREDMSEAKRRVDNIVKSLSLPGIYTQAVDEESKVIILGNVKTPQDKERMAVALGSLKDKIVDLSVVKEEEATVNIDVQVLELDRDATDTLGITNPLSTTAGITISEIGSPALRAAGATIGQFFRMPDFTRPTAFSWTLYALVQEGKARILSRPNLSCQSGKEAELLVGGEKPVFTTTVAATTGATGTSVEYKEFGIKLNIKPIVTDDKRIKLSLKVEVSDVETAEFIGLTTNRTAQAYPLTKRNASTELYIDSGKTMAIGGLMKQKTEEDIIKTPWLGDIPIVGYLFKKRVTKTGSGAGARGNVELFITLTPTIVDHAQKAAVVAAPEKKQIKLEPVSVAIDTNIPQPVAGYAGIIQKRILENLSYPAEAKQSGFQGTVKLKLHLSYLGALLGAEIQSSSGYKILDDNAMNAAKRISSYPPFPTDIESKELWVEIPIVYRLD